MTQNSSPASRLNHRGNNRPVTQFKHANPKYGKWEEDLTNDFLREVGLPEHCEPLYNKWGEEVACQ